MTSAPAASALLKACRLDVVAFKPGNVSLCGPAHGMCADDFLLSARVAVPALCRAGLGVGARVEAAIEATWAAVGCNTNLGIVLLLAPLAVASERGGSLREALAQVLAGLGVDDAEHAYAGIRRANPAGLGRAAEADVATAPSVDLLSAMRLAAGRDSVARQYAHGYGDVFDRGVPLLRALRRRWRSLAWATTACYLDYLATWPDSHVVRKHGAGCAGDVRARVAAVATALKACENPRSLAAALVALDGELKTRGVNPGTSADLTVASVAVLLLLDRFPAHQKNND